jgi:dsRNA-specific ribonuclease
VRQKRFALDQNGNLLDQDKALSELLPVRVHVPGTVQPSLSREPDKNLEELSSAKDGVLKETPSAGNDMSATILAACAIEVDGVEDILPCSEREVDVIGDRNAESGLENSARKLKRNSGELDTCKDAVDRHVLYDGSECESTTQLGSGRAIGCLDLEVSCSKAISLGSDFEGRCSEMALARSSPRLRADDKGIHHNDEACFRVNGDTEVTGSMEKKLSDGSSQRDYTPNMEVSFMDDRQPLPSVGQSNGQCEELEQSVAETLPDDSRKRKIQMFDPARNRKRRRSSWYGPVRESYASYFSSSKKAHTERLDQPLLPVSQAECIKICEFSRILDGTPMSNVIREIYDANAAMNPDGKLSMIPEMMHPYPVSVGLLFLPAMLQTLERHITTCALRDIITDAVGTVIDIPSLLQAVTSTVVNPSFNYERLELLGDAVLKLTATLRVFVKYPHKPEGDLHPLRCGIVSNHALQIKGQDAGIHQFLNFGRESLSDWKPPGWDSDAPPFLVHDKALADVVEAIAGAYYLKGAAEYAAEHGNESRLETTDAEAEPGADLSTLTKAVIHGYKISTRFYEAIHVLDGPEPDFNSILLSTIHSFHPPSTPAPKSDGEAAFPVDKRLLDPEIPWERHLGVLEESIGYRFQRRQLLFCALTHGSYAESVDTKGNLLVSLWSNFQRLEFLGDAAIDFCVARYLFDRYPDQGPGELTDLKSAVVSNETFARVAVRHGMHNYLYTRSVAMKREVELYLRALKEENTLKGQSSCSFQWLSEREAPKVLGDIFEAIAGAILVDAGMETVWNVYMRLLEETLRDRADPAKFETHPVKVFQDFVMKVQRLSVSPPHYVVPRTMSSRRLIRADVYVQKIKIASGEGSTKKRAMCRAAMGAHQRLASCAPGSDDAKLLHALRLKSDKERAALSVAKQKPPTCVPR